jgi:hypothetical protein
MLRYRRQRIISGLMAEVEISIGGEKILIRAFLQGTLGLGHRFVRASTIARSTSSGGVIRAPGTRAGRPDVSTAEPCLHGSGSLLLTFVGKL